MKSMMMVEKLIDEKLKEQMEVDPKTKKRIPKKSLATKTYEWCRAVKKNSPERFRNMFTLDHLDRLHELSFRRGEMMDIPTLKELIKLEEKSHRTPTIKEILRDKPLDEFEEVKKALPFAEEEEEEEEKEGEISTAEGDATEVEGEEEEEEVSAELGEETETS